MEQTPHRNHYFSRNHISVKRHLTFKLVIINNESEASLKKAMASTDAVRFSIQEERLHSKRPEFFISMIFFLYFLGEGGDLTLFMTGKKQRPSTEPVYSGGNRNVFPITSGYNEVEYTDFISSHIKNSANILVSQSLCNGTFSGCFAPSNMYSPRPALTWGIRKDYDSFLEFVKEKWKWINGKSFSIYSLACDENLGFGVFFTENYGTAQTIILTGNTEIQKKYDEGFMITACAARGSTFYVVMTKDTEEYKGKAQTWITGDTWTEACDKISEKYKERKIITGICYSTGLKQYGVVMTESSEGQTSRWFDDGPDTNNWMDEQHQVGYHPTVIFKDPTNNKIFVVMTTDKNRTDYIYRINYKLK